MSDCERTRPRLAGLLEGEASALVAAHVASCPGCAAELEALRRTRELIASAALEHSPRPGLEDEVFGFLELEPVSQAVRGAALEATPPADLERRSLERAGAVGPRRPRVAAAAVPVLAACVVVLAVLGLRWRSEARDMRESFGPSPRARATFNLTGLGTAPRWPSIRAVLVRQWGDHFALMLRLHDYPPNDPGEYCELWLVTHSGQRYSLGPFHVDESDPPTITVVKHLPPVDDPARVEMSIEPVSGTPALEGPVVAWARIEL